VRSHCEKRQFDFHVCLSVRIEKLSSTERCTFHDDQHTFLIISRSVILRMRNVSDGCCKENQNAVKKIKML
jgi:hypothetical protein